MMVLWNWFFAIWRSSAPFPFFIWLLMNDRSICGLKKWENVDRYIKPCAWNLKMQSRTFGPFDRDSVMGVSVGFQVQLANVSCIFIFLKLPNLFFNYQIIIIKQNKHLIAFLRFPLYSCSLQGSIFHVTVNSALIIIIIILILFAIRLLVTSDRYFF